MLFTFNNIKTTIKSNIIRIDTIILQPYFYNIKHIYDEILDTQKEIKILELIEVNSRAKLCFRLENFILTE